MSMNRVLIMGRLVKSPELRYTGNNIPVACFSLAVDRDHSSKEDGSKEADFLDFVAWRSTAEFVTKHLSKGRMIGVDGRLQSRNYTDKDGKNRKAVEIVAERIYFADSKRNDDAGYQNTYQPEASSDFAVTSDDEPLPF